MATVPVPYIGGPAGQQTVLGHYAVAQTSGAIAATPTALDCHASIRGAPTLSNTFLVLMRIKLGWSVITAVATAVQIAYQAQIARGFTVDFTTASTAINLSTTGKTNQMRGSMSQSQMGANGPRICTTTVMSGQTATLDAAPFAITNWNAIYSSSATGTATNLVAGSAGPMQTLYEWTGLGQHPVVLGNNEGVFVKITNTGWAGGTVSLYTQWEWAEVFAF